MTAGTEPPGPPPRVLVTRASEDSRVLAHALSVAGYEAVEVPLLQRVWQVDAVADAACRCPDADLVLVTSATTADVLGVAAPEGWARARFAAVGPATARRLEELGFPVDLVPEHATGAHLLTALGDVDGLRVFYPKADLAPPTLGTALRARGARVDEVIAYTNGPPPGFQRRLAEALPVDATTLLSGSAAQRLAEAVPADERHKLGLVVVIGPSTQAVADRVGVEVHAVADPYTVTGLVDALRRLLPP